MPAPLTFAVEFATDKAKATLGGLVDEVRSFTIPSLQSVLAPISPANLVTQIAQQGLGMNALGGNLVNGALGAIGNSRFSYLTEAGAQFNAENNAMSGSIAQLQQLRALGVAPSNESRDLIWQLQLQRSKADEEERMAMLGRKGQDVAQADYQKLKDIGSKAWEDAKPHLAPIVNRSGYIDSTVKGLDSVKEMWLDITTLRGLF
jgi:hypothetical protein